MEGAKTQEELRATLIAKAAQDDVFRTKLVDDPKAAVKEALGLDLPEAVSVHVHEESAGTAHLVLPPSASLADAELEAITAGHSASGSIYIDPKYNHRHGDGPIHS